MHIIEIALFAFLSFSVLYLLIFATAGRFASHEIIPTSAVYKKGLVLLPSFKEDEVIISSAKAVVDLNYPTEKFQAVVLADSLAKTTVDILKTIKGLDVLELVFDKSTKVKSLQKAIEKYYNKGFDFVSILDADNIAEVDYLLKVNDALSMDYKSIQARRVAKNINNDIAVLDAVSEGINNHIFRKGYNALGASASLIGSGMAFDFKEFSRIILTMNSVGGFDRELHAMLLKSGIKTKYLNDTIVYDEKVDNTKSLGNQRRRWISSQFFYLRKYFLEGFIELFKGNLNYFDATVLSNMILPRVLLLGMLVIFSIISIIINDYLVIPWYYWMALLSGLIIALLISIPVNYLNKKTFKAICLLPVSFFTVLKSLLFSWNSNKEFIHTPHGVQEVKSKIE